MRSSIVLILSFSLIGSGIFVPNSSAQDTQIPNWIKNVAGWWASDIISETEFLTGIEYLINNNIILLDFVPCNVEIQSQYGDTKSIPDWIKNNANWWSENLINDIDFINGLQYLIEHKIIKIDNKKILGKVPLEDIKFSSSWQVDKNFLVFAKSAFFEIYGGYGKCIISDGAQVWESISLGLNPNKMDMYNEVAVWNDPQKTVVVYPYFTFAAYSEPGFYAYYRGECDDCTTTKFAQPTPLYTSSGMGHQVLTLLGYTSITDVEIDKNPGILQQFDKVIMLHNEYVTRAMFDAITSHPNVIYLYPNALYAEIEVDYVDETITLIRGHNYPESSITNGFDWEFDNTHPYEYDKLCADMKFYQIENGWMTNCYPENFFLQNHTGLFNLLKTIKNL
uniref:Uncharacterized protein n=1 Tax=uncultured marine thaumarchaeote KM3_98_B07 TaxID=1456351 RepID=A0A075I2P4_9ARCH|nr:hypothetical protein [uncultured marine thaumarchaeote KM3_98_B07]